MLQARYSYAPLLKACHRHVASQAQAATAVAATGEYTAVPEYPPIKDLSFKARKQNEKETWHQAIQNANTVEEKQIKINMPRYYGYKVTKLSDQKLPYNCLPAVQHYTRTLLEESVDKQTEENAEISKQIDSFVENLKGPVQDTIEFVHDYFRNKQLASEQQLDAVQSEQSLTQQLVEQINRDIFVAMSADFAHLKEVEEDWKPRHEAFWFVGGIRPPKNVVRGKQGRKWQKDMAEDPVDRPMQYNGTPYLALRHQLQLTPWKAQHEYEDIALTRQVPRYNYDPRTLGYACAYQHGTNIPGYWPAAHISNFGLISFQSRAHLLLKPQACGAEDFAEALHAEAILSSYAWLLAQANYNGFNTFSELTYPMNTQTILTNGRDWSFYEYQLNTLLLHSYHIDENPRVNFCRGSKEMQLYAEVNSEGKCIGFNEQVLRKLIKVYMQTPTIKRSRAELQPFLHPQFRYAADYTDAQKREFLDATFKHICANRPRHLELPEIYMWEKIYKIDNKTRPMEARRRFFEVFINPWKRTLDQHHKVYIPRALRAEGPKSKNKWQPTFYP